MAYKFTEKTNSKQQQTTYVLYMMISSYFHKSICKTKILETMLHLYYQELCPSRQEKLEAKVIADTEKELKEALSVLSQMNCEVSIRRGDAAYDLKFETGFESISVTVDRKGNYRIKLQDEQLVRGGEFV